MRNKMLYYGLMFLAIIPFSISLNLLNNIKVIVPAIISIRVYLFVGVFIKLCKTKDKLKNTVICLINLLFWLP